MCNGCFTIRRKRFCLARCMSRAILTALALVTFSLFFTSVATTASGMDQVTIEEQGTRRQIEGKIVTEAVNGQLLLLATDGKFWVLEPKQVLERTSDETPFTPVKREALEKLLLQEFPGFKIHKTTNYLICYNTSPAYAQWCGGLFERLHRGFQNFWSRKRFPVHTSELPLVAILYDGRESFQKHVHEEIGEASQSYLGYYSPTSNRVHLLDLTGVEERKRGERTGARKRMSEVLARPEALPQIAAIVHEATHQLAYNCGVQTRLADNPAWVSEGLAMYFETPDLNSTSGWTSIGLVSANRLQQMRQYQPTRPVDSLETLIRDEQRFHTTKDMALDAYAEAWALNHFLFTRHQAEYIAYLKKLAEKPSGEQGTPETRLEEFKAAFGDLQKLDTDFLRYIATLP